MENQNGLGDLTYVTIKNIDSYPGSIELVRTMFKWSSFQILVIMTFALKRKEKTVPQSLFLTLAQFKGELGHFTLV